MNDLPGFKAANDYGYSLHSYSGDRNSADYMKGQLTLRIVRNPSDGKLEARLMAMHNIVRLEVGPFSFPHQHLTAWAVRILNLLPKDPR